jgi:hypothetical protein
VQDVDSPLTEARRNARFTYASRRIQKIVEGAPPLTVSQRRELAAILLASAQSTTDGAAA